jgi:hypothetical protein
MLHDGGDQTGPVADGGHHLEAATVQEPGQALAEE